MVSREAGLGWDLGLGFFLGTGLGWLGCRGLGWEKVELGWVFRPLFCSGNWARLGGLGFSD